MKTSWKVEKLFPGREVRGGSLQTERAACLCHLLFMGCLAPARSRCVFMVCLQVVTPMEMFSVWSLDYPFLLRIFSAWTLSFRYLSSSLMSSFFCIRVLPPDGVAALLRVSPYPSGLRIPTALLQHFVHLRPESLLFFFKYLKYFKIIYLFFWGGGCAGSSVLPSGFLWLW